MQSALNMMTEEEKAKYFLDIAGVIIVAINKNLQISLMNKMGCEILEREEEDIVGKDAIDLLIPHAEQTKVKNVLTKLLNGQDEKSFEFFENKIITRSGKERDIQWKNKVIRDKDGIPIYILSSGLDITEVKNAERQLERIEKKYEEIVESFPDAIIIFDENRICIEIYPSSIHTKYPLLYSMVGQKTASFISEDQYSQFSKILDKIDQDRNYVDSFRLNIDTINFGPRLFDATIKAFNDNKYIAIARDITDTEKLKVLIEFQSAINSLSNNNKKIMDRIFKTKSKVEE